MRPKVRKIDIFAGDFETQKQQRCWTGQKKQFVALKRKSQNKLSKLSNVDEKLTDCGWKSRGFRFLSRVD